MAKMIDSKFEENRWQLPNVMHFTCKYCFNQYKNLDDLANHKCEKNRKDWRAVCYDCGVKSEWIATHDEVLEWRLKITRRCADSTASSTVSGCSRKRLRLTN